MRPRRSRAAVATLAGLAVAALATAGFAGQKIQRGTLIHLADGDVQGHTSGGAREFLGIPFAATPVGALRWRPPAPVVPWQGVLQASAYAPACAQLASLQSGASDSEDCLYLNVWTPDPAPSKPRPVMVWFHGGANVTGSASDVVPFPDIPGHIYDGHVLSEEDDVVVVTIQYRLGVLGFFGHSALAAEDSSYPYAGNQGLLDQRAALAWVRDNIAAFGGNPKKVTIFGESAGSADVCYQIASPGSRKLFQRGISESGGCTTRQRTAAEGAATAEALATAVGCAGAGDELACLRQVSPSTLLASMGSLPFGPLVDGGFLPDQPRTLFDDGRYARVPYVLGTNADEGTIFFITTPAITTEAQYLAELQLRYGSRAAEVAALYPASSFPTPQDALERVVGDAGLVCGTYDTARRAAAGGARTYLYNFARALPLPILEALELHAFHGVEMAYVFGIITPPTADDARLGTTVRGYWTKFARSGNPNHRGAPKWPRFKDATDRRLNLDLEPSVLTHFRRSECAFWWSVYDAQFAGGSPSGAFVD
jgi:para-nitrobenzyl esterase